MATIRHFFDEYAPLRGGLKYFSDIENACAWATMLERHYLELVIALNTPPKMGMAGLLNQHLNERKAKEGGYGKLHAETFI